ncbi:MAG: hypothetical protein O7D32_06280, partial [bacterium]|nr:hypothetical protein [bacterium]
RLYAEMDDGVPRNPLPRSVFEGLVILQPGLDEPTMTITLPNRNFSPTLNQKIAVRWDDENTDDNTKITIRFDDDPIPNESTETGDPELTIRPDVPADPDPGDPGTSGNPDETLWDWHPADITEPAVPAGDYFIFGYIGNNGDPLNSPDLVTIVPFIATIRNTAPELEFSNPGAAGGEFPSPSGGNIIWNERDADEDTVTIELWLDPDDTFSENLNREIQIATSDDVASLADAPVFPWGGPGRSFPWDGLDSSGQSVETGAYRLVAVLNDSTNGDVTVEATGLVNFRPDANSAVILMASQFVSSSVGTEGNVNISYRTIPVTGSETVELYFDNDNDPTDDLGTEIEPLESKPSDANVLHTFAWDLGAKDPEVAAGTYFIHARLMDGAVEKDVSTSRASIEVTGQTVTPTFDFLRPLLNGLDVVSGTDNVNIEWEYASSQTGTLSLEADPDMNSGNNNEILILSNRVLDPAPDGVSASFDWDLTDTGGADVPTGTYLIRGRFVVTSALARIADGTVRVRKSASAPLVAFTQPTGNTNYINGETPDRDILIRWDVDPLEPNPDVRVDIWFDREPSPEADAGILTEGEPLSGLTGLGITSGIIVEDLDASQGVFDWTAQLQPEFLTNVDTTWYIHIRIRDGALPADDDRATAVGTIRVN